MNLDTNIKLNGLAHDAASVEQDSGGFMEPGTKVKKKRGPKGPWKHKVEDGPIGTAPRMDAGPSLPQDPVQELLPLTTQMTAFYSNMLVQIAEDEKARLDSDTSKIMAHTSATCLNQYFPNAMGKHAALIVLLCVVGQTSFTAYTLRQQNLAKYRAEKAARDRMNGMNKPPTWTESPSSVEV